MANDVPRSTEEFGEEGAVFEALEQAWPLYERYLELAGINDAAPNRTEWLTQSAGAPVDLVILTQ